MPNPTGINQYTGGASAAKQSGDAHMYSAQLASKGGGSSTEHQKASDMHASAAMAMRAAGRFQEAHAHEGLSVAHGNAARDARNNPGLMAKEAVERRAEQASEKADHLSQKATLGGSRADHEAARLAHVQAAEANRAAGYHADANDHDKMATVHSKAIQAYRDTGAGAQLAEQSRAANVARAGRHAEILRGISAGKSDPMFTRPDYSQTKHSEEAQAGHNLRAQLAIKADEASAKAEREPSTSNHAMAAQAHMKAYEMGGDRGHLGKADYHNVQRRLIARGPGR